jgi:hypothetical protein
MYEIFVYIGEENRLHGNYLKIVHMDGKPIVGSDAGGGYRVTGVYEMFGIIDVVVG